MFPLEYYLVTMVLSVRYVFATIQAGHEIVAILFSVLHVIAMLPSCLRVATRHHFDQNDVMMIQLALEGSRTIVWVTILPISVGVTLVPPALLELSQYSSEVAVVLMPLDNQDFPT